MKERNPILNPQEGDILQRSDGVYVLVDYVTDLNVGFMCTDKITGSYQRDDWVKWMNGAVVIERGAPETCPWNNPEPRIPTRRESTDYLEKKVTLIYG